MRYSKNVAGIDLGTTNSCIAVYKHQRVEVVEDDQGKRTFPSCVSFTDTGRIFGLSAKKKLATNYKNTIYDVKRLIGHAYTDSVVQEDIKNWPFTVEPDYKGNPVVRVKYNGNEELFAPEMISSFIVEYLVDVACRYSGEDITDIVITVPAYFNDSQRQATINAGTIAGFSVLHVLNEPTAAAIAYGFDNQDNDKNILVYDLGGGTFDSTILHLHEHHYDVVGTDGDTHLGGDDLDIIMSRLLIRLAREQGMDIDETDKRLMAKIRKLAEDTKIELSSTTETEIDEEFLCNEPIIITRQAFIDEAHDFFDKTIVVLDRLLATTGLTANMIDDVVLIGGSSRIPYIKEMLQKKFGVNKVNEKINPDEAVAKGACIYAVKLMDEKHKDEPDSDSSSDSESEDGLQDDKIGDFYSPIAIKEITIQDVLPLSVGVKNSEKLLSVILPKNTPYGQSNFREYVTSRDYQKQMKIHVGQGERPLFTDNHEIGTIKFTFPPLPRGEITVRIELSTDQNGVLKIHVSDNLGNNSVEHTFESISTVLTLEEIIKMKQTAEEMRHQDELLLQKAHLLNDIESRVYEIEKRCKELDNQMDADYKADVRDFLESIHAVIKQRDFTLEQLEEFKDSTEQWYNSINGF